MPSGNWTTVAESRFPWEREAFEFIRQRFPQHDPYRAWSNFEFIADDGSINEVGRSDGIPGMWLLLPGDLVALIDGKAVPLIGPGQRAQIPESWLMNTHRAANAPSV